MYSSCGIQYIFNSLLNQQYAEDRQNMTSYRIRMKPAGWHARRGTPVTTAAHRQADIATCRRVEGLSLRMRDTAVGKIFSHLRRASLRIALLPEGTRERQKLNERTCQH